MVMRKGKVVHAGQFGHRDAEAGLEITPDTIFRIYSMTKPIVSTALMLLHEAAAFQLHDPVAKYLPAFGATQVLGADGSLAPQARPMEIRDLLTHTSGLTYDFMEDTPVGQLYRDARIMNDATRTLEEVIDVLAKIPLSSQPGSRWHYGLGIDVAARLIEVLSGQSLGAFLAERVFEPLGMTDTGFGVADSNLNRLSAMYGLPDLIGLDHTGTKLAEAALGGFNERIDVSATYPTGAPEVFARGGLGLFSTIGDYANFAQMLLNGGQLDGTRIIGPQDARTNARQPPPTGATTLGASGTRQRWARIRARIPGDDGCCRQRRSGLRRRVRVGRCSQDLLLGRPRRRPGWVVHVAVHDRGRAA